MIGGTLIQTTILLWITFRTDWNKEVRASLAFDYQIIITLLTVTCTGKGL
jgi:hypothetical protein